MAKRRRSQIDAADDLMSERVKRLALGSRSASPQMRQNTSALSVPLGSSSSSVAVGCDTQCLNTEGDGLVDDAKTLSESTDAMYEAQASRLRALHFARLRRTASGTSCPD